MKNGSTAERALHTTESMRILHTTGTLLVQVGRSPAFLLVALVTLTARWVIDLALPLGLSTQRTHELAAAYEVAYLGGLTGAALTAREATRLRPTFRALDGPTRVLAGAASGFGAALAIGACAVVPAHLTRTWQGLPFHANQSLIALALAWLGFVAFAAFACEWFKGARAAAVLAPGAAFLATLLLPVALPSPLNALFEFSAPLRATFDLSALPAHWRAPIWSTLLWGSLAVALAAPPRTPGIERASHALRNPR